MRTRHLNLVPSSPAKSPAHDTPPIRFSEPVRRWSRLAGKICQIKQNPHHRFNRVDEINEQYSSHHASLFDSRSQHQINYH